MNIPSRFIEEAGVKKPIPKGRVSGISSDFDFNQDGGTGDDYNQDAGLSRQVVEGSTRTRGRAGQRVVHPDFGEGKILDVEGSGDHAKATIQFINGLKKKLLLKYAPLEFR
jgi:DNA helicase-2/ATP-dependent DNA helicase PcrA